MQIQGPDGKVHTFPDGMPGDAVKTYMRQLYPAPSQGAPGGAPQTSAPPMGLRGAMADGAAPPQQQPQAPPQQPQQAMPPASPSAAPGGGQGVDPKMQRMIDNMPALHAMFPDMAKGVMESPAYKQAQTAAQIQQRARDAESLGIEAGSPEYRQYVLTGHLPKIDPDRSAIRKADENLVHIDNTMDRANRAIELNKDAYTGPTAGLRSTVGGWFGADGAEKTQLYENNAKMLAAELARGVVGGRVTNYEMELMQRLNAGINQPENVRREILQDTVKHLQKSRDLVQRQSEELRAGTYYKPGAGKPASKATWSIERVD